MAETEIPQDVLDASWAALGYRRMPRSETGKQHVRHVARAIMADRASRAPDRDVLVEALRDIAGSAGEHGERGTSGDGHADAIQTARAALSK